jgi:threonine dehydrogenase-like Zn-dependent dehydrogenase
MRRKRLRSYPTRTLHWIERQESAITVPHEVKMSVVPIGICGTDLEEVAGGRALAPCGESDLVAGHGVWSKVLATAWKSRA